MSVYNLNNASQYMQLVKDVQQYKENKQLIEVKKFHPIATDKQKAYLNFIIRYYSNKVGQTFYQTLSEIQQGIAPHVFETGEYDKHGYPKYKKLCFLNTAEASSVIRNFLDFANSREIMIPDAEDALAMRYCEKSLESGEGWI